LIKTSNQRRSRRREFMVGENKWYVFDESTLELIKNLKRELEY
jgi:hypothetical protein